MSPNRRDTLHLLASAGLVGLAGCLDQTGGTQTSTTTDPETTTTTTEESTTTQPTDSTATEQVRIENRTDSRRVVSVEVLDDAEATLIAGTYEVPATTGLRIDHEFEWASYTVRGTVDGGDWHAMEWEPRSCSSTPAPDGNMDAGVVVTDDGVEVVHNTCDYLKLGSVYIDTYEPAAEFEVSE